ncbi:MAG TPA: FAD-dependent oxidoreductase [Chloroflexota bacterium]|jgi:glycine/D-amino acid oxidase-like deaminating enzyme
MPSIVVIGAGVVGTAVAYRLAAAGATVTLVDQGEPGAGTTSASFAWLNANNKPPAAYHALNVAGIHAHRRLAADLGTAPWLHLTGSLRCAVGDMSTKRLTAHVAALQGLGYPAELINRHEAQALEPAVRWPDATDTAFASFPLEGWADGPLLVFTLLAAAQSLGTTVQRSDGVTALDHTSDRATGVHLVSGTRLHADHVVIAAGRWSDRVAVLAGLRVPLAPTCGLLALTAPLPRGPRSVVHAPDVQFRPEAGGRVVLQADDIDTLVDPTTPRDPNLPACRELWRRACAYLPDLSGASIVEARVGVRALPTDGYPLVGYAPGCGNLYLAITHSGMTLGPLLGELVAAEVLGAAPDPRLATFRPDRCVTRR